MDNQLDSKLFINEKILESATEICNQFENASPYKHVQLDNFFNENLIDRMIAEFPEPKKHEMFNEFGGPSLKHTVADVRSIGPAYRELDDYIASSSFKKLIGDLTGIDDLIYDSKYFGGGTHNNLSGQGMDPHVDFNYLDIPSVGKVHRRINAIVYLNDEWDESWGGNLDLHFNPWDPASDQIIRVVPKKNRLILFETNEVSWHGFHPANSLLPTGTTRKSFAIYMYTKDRPDHEIKPFHNTFYVPRIPLESLKLGSSITQEVLDELTTARVKTLGLIQGIYGQEMGLNQYIADRQYEINVLKAEMTLLKEKLKS
jgi:hypothetical protein